MSQNADTTKDALRQIFREMDAHQAQEIREAYYKAVEELMTLAETLEVADAQQQVSGPLLTEHLNTVEALDAMGKSRLGQCCRSVATKAVDFIRCNRLLVDFPMVGETDCRCQRKDKACQDDNGQRNLHPNEFPPPQRDVRYYIGRNNRQYDCEVKMKARADCQLEHASRDQ